MTTLKTIGAIAVILCAVAVLSSGPMKGAQGNQPQTYTITITPNEDPTQPPAVEPDEQEVGSNDQVEWTCSTGCDFTVVFIEAGRKPFKNRAFDQTRSKSGHPTGPTGKYKYSVIVGEGVVDPSIIVH